MSDHLTGFRRSTGTVGIRSHLLVLPSVVCSTHAAAMIAEEAGAVSITHQHGCLQVGDDLTSTSSQLSALATAPNVGAVLVVSLGCETLNGRRLAESIAAAGQRVELVGIQSSGGTNRAVLSGRDLAGRLLEEMDGERREPLDAGELCVGIDNAEHRLSVALADALEGRGVRVVMAERGQRGSASHVWLTAQGAQLLVSLPDADEGPVGFAISPVLAVAADSELHRGLADDFDIVPDDDEAEVAFAARIAERVLVHAGGVPTAAERRGAVDCVIRRLAVTM